MQGRENDTGMAAMTWCAAPLSLMDLVAECANEALHPNSLAMPPVRANQRAADGTPTLHSVDLRGSMKCALYIHGATSALQEACRMAPNVPFVAALVVSLKGHVLHLGPSRKACRASGMARSGALALQQHEEGAKPFAFRSADPAAQQWFNVRRQQLNFNGANSDEFTLLPSPDGIGLTRISALGLTGASYNDAAAEHFTPLELERPGAAYAASRQRTSSVHLEQRSQAGGSRHGTGKPVIFASVQATASQALSQLVGVDVGKLANAPASFRQAFTRILEAHSCLSTVVAGLLREALRRGCPHVELPAAPSGGVALQALRALGLAVAASGGRIGSTTAGQLAMDGMQAMCGVSAHHAHSIKSTYGDDLKKVNASVLDRALSAADLLRVEPLLNRKRNAGSFRVTAARLQGNELLVLQLTVTKTVPLKAAEINTISSTGEVFNAQSKACLSDVSFQRITLGAHPDAAFDSYPADMPALGSMLGDLESPDGYQWRLELQGGQQVCLMGQEGQLSGKLLASGVTVATAGSFEVAGQLRSPALVIPTRSGSPAGLTRVAVQLHFVHPAARRALAGSAGCVLLEGGQPYQVALGTAMLQRYSPSQARERQQAAADAAAQQQQQQQQEAAVPLGLTVQAAGSPPAPATAAEAAAAPGPLLSESVELVQASQLVTPSPARDEEMEEVPAQRAQQAQQASVPLVRRLHIPDTYTAPEGSGPVGMQQRRRRAAEPEAAGSVASTNTDHGSQSAHPTTKSRRAWSSHMGSTRSAASQNVSPNMQACGLPLVPVFAAGLPGLQPQVAAMEEEVAAAAAVAAAAEAAVAANRRSRPSKKRKQA